MIQLPDSSPMTTLRRGDPLARGLLCAVRMNGHSPASANLVYPHLLIGAVAPGGLATPIVASHQHWYNRFGAGYSICFWHDGVTLGAWDSFLDISDSTLAWLRYGSNNCLRVYHNGTGYTLPNVLLSYLTDPGLFVGIWAPPQLSAYVNGRLIETVACYQAPKTTSSTSALTMSGSATMRQFLAYDRPLSVAEIQRLCRDPSAVFGRTRRWPPVVAPTGTIHTLSGSISADASLSGTARITRRLSSVDCTTGSSVSGSLSVLPPEPEGVSAPEPWRPWRRAILCNGAGSDGFKLGTVLTRGWFWVRRKGCTAVYQGPDIGQVDFDHPLSVANADAEKIALPAWTAPEPGSESCFVTRRFNGHGDQEQTTGAAVLVRMDADGKLADPMPNDVFALHAVQVHHGRVRLQWFYCPLDQQTEPAQFNVYASDASDQIDFEAPLATIPYRGRRFYQYLTEPLPDGMYRFAVRAETANGTETASTRTSSCVVCTAQPKGITLLNAEAVL